MYTEACYFHFKKIIFKNNCCRKVFYTSTHIIKLISYSINKYLKIKILPFSNISKKLKRMELYEATITLIQETKKLLKKKITCQYLC